MNNNITFYFIIFSITIYYLLFHKHPETYENQKTCSDMKEECGFMNKEELLKELERLKRIKDKQNTLITQKALNNPSYKIPKKSKGSGPNGELLPGVDYDENLIEENQKSARTLNTYTSKLCEIANKYDMNETTDPEETKRNIKESIKTIDEDITQLKSKPEYDKEELEILEEEKQDYERRLKDSTPTLADLCSLSYTPTGEDPIYESKMIDLRKRMLYDMYGEFDIGSKFKKKFEKRVKRNYMKGMKYYDKNKNKRKKSWRKKRKGRKRKKQKAVKKSGFFGELKEAHYLDKFNKDSDNNEDKDETSIFTVPPIDQEYLDMLTSMGLKTQENFYDIDSDLKSRIGGTINELEKIIKKEQGNLKNLENITSKVNQNLWSA